MGIKQLSLVEGYAASNGQTKGDDPHGAAGIILANAQGRYAASSADGQNFRANHERKLLALSGVNIGYVKTTAIRSCSVASLLLHVYPDHGHLCIGGRSAKSARLRFHHGPNHRLS